MGVPPRVTDRLTMRPDGQDENLALAKADGEWESLTRPLNVAIEGIASDDSLPVLGAIREFIDVERRRTRRIVLAMTAFFVVLMVIVLGAAAIVGRAYFGQLRREMSGDRRAVKAVRAEILQVRSQAIGETRRLEGEMRLGSMAIESAKSRVDALDGGVSTALLAIVALKGYVDRGALHIGQESAASLDAVERKLQSLTNRIDALWRENAELRADILKVRERAISVPDILKSLETATPPRTVEPIFLSIPSSNAGERIDIRLPIPSS